MSDPEDYNDLQAYLEGDPRQQDAAALRLDRVLPEALFCLHQDAARTSEPLPPDRVHTVHRVDCPACGLWAVRVDVEPTLMPPAPLPEVSP